MNKAGLEKLNIEGDGVLYSCVESKEPELTAEQKIALIQEIGDLLEEYKWHPTEIGLTKMVERWWEQNKNLIALMQKHPNYNGRYQIIFPQEFARRFDATTARNFSNFWLNNMRSDKFLKPLTLEDDGVEISGREFFHKYKHLKQIFAYFDDWHNKGTIKTYEDLILDGHDFTYWSEKLRILREVEESSEYTKESRQMKNAYENFMYYIKALDKPNLTEEQAKKLNEYMSPVYPKCNAAAGQKTSRIVNKICLFFGLDNFEREEQVWVHDHYEKKMVKPYQREFAKYADAVNPLNVVRNFVLSVHPVDYLTQSFGVSWSSCHTIDKTNIRKSDGDTYQGMHCDGTVSYMLDATSLVAYTIDGGYKGTTPELENKIMRNMFHWGKSKLIQGRLYPQGNDGDSSIYEEYRAIVQKIFALCLGKKNTWKINIGTSHCRDNVKNDGTAYPDWENNSQCNVGYLLEDSFSSERLSIGATPICIHCGRSYDVEGTLNCCNSDDGNMNCAECGSSSDEMHEIDGEWYCEDCCFYCDVHERWELYSDHERVYVMNCGYACKDGAIEHSKIHYCEGCDEYFWAEEPYTDESGYYYCSRDCRARMTVLIGNNYYHEDDDRIVYCEACGDALLDAESEIYNGEVMCPACAAEAREEEEEEEED